MLQFDTGLPGGEQILLVALGLTCGLFLVALAGLVALVALLAASSTAVASTTWRASSLVVISTHLDS